MSRLAWSNLPKQVRLAVESQLGATVVQAVSQSSGFSPGSADRLVLSDGRKVFVKAVAADVNPDSIKIHRREAEVLATLPSGLPVAQLLGLVDTGDWVALILEDVDGHQPTWDGDEIVRVLGTLVALASVQPDPAILGTLRQSMNDDFQGWQSLTVDMELRFDDTTNAWIERHQNQLIDLENGAIGRGFSSSLRHASRQHPAASK